MITETKRIRTKKGDPMMFATLDDLETSVEMIVFGKPLLACEEALAPDSIVIVRGRVDHKDREKTCLIVQQADLFQPTEEEVAEAQEREAVTPTGPEALRLRLDANALPASVLGELRELLTGFPGESEVVIELRTSIGERRLKLGTQFKVERNASLHAELDQLLGAAILAEERIVAEAVQAPASVA
jgi:DNA polymerase-3 subunit alpha